MLIYQSVSNALIGAFGLGLLFAAPWIVTTVWLWRERDDDGTAVPSLGETLLRRVDL
jgi:hypothetical protein